ncbi:TadE-like protein [Motilibacter peucedani]|uniref:TadE-like protein n=1 Tax=Motilibacter peucedani TaxID=598650 RepID=A0A420XN35_9ACTN|nr:TadE/TadG family type IV pilus assembly protein [Motilibacter peucedani]RKS72679.1 TadE-like protein [Motilibacter peucedani]
MRPPALRRALHDDSGAAVVEFCLVVAVVVPMVLAILQFGLVLHVRNTLQAEAAEGARVAAAADRTPVDGRVATASLVSGSFGSGLGQHVTAGTSSDDGLPTVWVRVQADLPLVGWLAGVDGGIDVTAHAVDEGA